MHPSILLYLEPTTITNSQWCQNHPLRTSLHLFFGPWKEHVLGSHANKHIRGKRWLCIHAKSISPHTDLTAPDEILCFHRFWLVIPYSDLAHLWWKLFDFLSCLHTHMHTHTHIHIDASSTNNAFYLVTSTCAVHICMVYETVHTTDIIMHRIYCS